MARFDLLARVYDWLPIPNHPERVRERLEAAPGPRLDVGGGTGRAAVGIHGDHDPVLVDASSGMLARARRAGRAVRPVRGLGQALPFADASFGAATATEAFHHFAPDQTRVVDEVARVLAPDGVFVVEEIDPDRLLGRAVELGENLLLRFGSVFHAPDALADLVGRCFDRVETERTGSFTYLVEARRPRPPGGEASDRPPS